MSAQAFHKRLDRIEAKGVDLMKVWVNHDDAETERERASHMIATRGQGQFVVIDKFMADV